MSKRSSESENESGVFVHFLKTKSRQSKNSTWVARPGLGYHCWRRRCKTHSFHVFSDTGRRWPSLFYVTRTACTDARHALGGVCWTLESEVNTEVGRIWYGFDLILQISNPKFILDIKLFIESMLYKYVYIHKKEDSLKLIRSLIKPKILSDNFHSLPT